MDAGIAPTDSFVPQPGYKEITRAQQFGNRRTLNLAGGSSGGRFFVEETKKQENNTQVTPSMPLDRLQAHKSWS